MGVFFEFGDVKAVHVVHMRVVATSQLHARVEAFGLEPGVARHTECQLGVHQLHVSLTQTVVRNLKDRVIRVIQSHTIVLAVHDSRVITNIYK